MRDHVFPVQVRYLPAEGDDPPGWGASCEALRVNIDAPTLDDLMGRLNLVLPDMFEALTELEPDFAAAHRGVRPRFEVRHVLEGDGEGLLQATA